MFQLIRPTTWMLLTAVTTISIGVFPTRTLAQAFSILESPAENENANTAQTQAGTEELPLPPAIASEARPAVDSEAPPPPAYDPGSESVGRSAGPSPSRPLQSRGELVDRVMLHEAFATAAQGVVSAGPIVRDAPPQVIEENPQTQPSGTNVAWVDGYWAWHPVRQTYYWISGLWREIPPGRTWVSGQWFAAPGGYRWSNGYWDSATAPAEILAQRPPNSMEAGPTSTGSADSFWMPGQYTWQNGTYFFQPGYWTSHQDKFIWQPETYVQTPGGFAHVSGYWDFELEMRGVPFAPLSVPVDMARQMQLSVAPNILLAPEATLCLHMFSQPGDSHYYFGSYYSASDINQGLLPWHDPRSIEYSWSPLLSYYEWKFARQGVAFASAMAAYQSRYRSQAAMRPSVRAMSINGQAYAATDPLSSGASSLRQLLSAGGQVASRPQSSSFNPQPYANPGRYSTLGSNIGVPQPDRSFQSSQLSSQLSRQQIAVPSTAFLAPGLSLSITGPSTLRRGLPRAPVPSVRLGIPGIAIPPAFVPSPIGAPWNRPSPRVLVPPPAIPPIGPPGIRRGMRR